MSKVINIKKGLTINLKGVAESVFLEQPKATEFALKPTDFLGLTARLAVKENDEVLAGSPLFFDKNNPAIMFVSPVSGKVLSINRGDRRKLLEVVVQANQSNEYKSFDISNTASVDSTIQIMLEAGVWPCVKQRPFNTIANPADKPKSIHISTFDTSPLAPDYSFIIKQNLEEFKKGVSILSQLSVGGVNLNIKNLESDIQLFASVENVRKNYFMGPHPAGNVGIQIHHLEPINKGEVVWVLNPQDVIIIGRLFLKGIYDAQKIVAITGNISKPGYLKTLIGAKVSSIVNNQSIEFDSNRIISGNPLTGEKLTQTGYIGYYDSQITVLEEGTKPEFMGWIQPGLKKFSASRTFLSWLTPKKSYSLNTNLNGGERAFVFTGVYEKVLPMNIYPMQLLKAIIVNDIDKMEQLGIYEVVEEDFALCEFVCPSKIEIQSIIRQGLDTIKKEFS